MLNLSTISDEILLARGSYSTVRAAHEDAKKELQKMCGILQTVPSQILRKMQPGDDEVPEAIGELLDIGRKALDAIETKCAEIESLAQQRYELKSKAWTNQGKQ